ncbi:MAG: hypothetical protein SF053_03595 [Bacteroidia bacterium]|nr:hypothetical protein [Bacteroidia bacterium]
MHIHTVTLLLLVCIRVSAQDEAFHLLFPANESWTAQAPDEHPDYQSWSLYPQGQDQDDHTAAVTVTVFRERLSLGVGQVMAGIIEEERPLYQEARVTTIERRTAIDAPVNFILFSIEATGRGETPSRSTLYYILQGEAHTYIITWAVPGAGFPGKALKTWQKTLLNGSLQPVSQAEALRTGGATLQD